MLVAQITDIHLGFEPDSPREFNRLRLDATLAALKSLNPAPDLLLATGDLVDRGDVASYRRLREALAELPFPVHFAMGNHDDRDNFAAVFPEAEFNGGFLQYTLDAGPLRLVVIDTLEEGRHGGALCERRAQWLRDRLDQDRERPTLVVLHHPPIESGIAWMNTDPAEPWVHRLADALAGHNNLVGLICGHIHRAIATRWQGTVVATCPSTAPQVALELEPIDPERPDGRALIIADPPAYALHWWNGRELITHYDTAEQHQVLASYDEGLKSMIANMLAERPV